MRPFKGLPGKQTQQYHFKGEVSSTSFDYMKSVTVACYPLTRASFPFPQIQKPPKEKYLSEMCLFHYIHFLQIASIYGNLYVFHSREWHQVFLFVFFFKYSLVVTQFKGKTKTTPEVTEGKHKWGKKKKKDKITPNYKGDSPKTQDWENNALGKMTSFLRGQWEGFQGCRSIRFMRPLSRVHWWDRTNAAVTRFCYVLWGSHAIRSTLSKQVKKPKPKQILRT